MAGLNIEITGIQTTLNAVIKQIEEKTTKAIEADEEDLEKAIKSKMPKDTGKLQGSLRSKITSKKNETILEIFSTDPKANLVEEGTKFQKGIFFMRNTAAEQDRLVSDRISKRLKLK